jgi:hypothetical protein
VSIACDLEAAHGNCNRRQLIVPAKLNCSAVQGDHTTYKSCGEYAEEAATIHKICVIKSRKLFSFGRNCRPFLTALYSPPPSKSKRGGLPLIPSNMTATSEEPQGVHFECQLYNFKLSSTLNHYLI